MRKIITRILTLTLAATLLSGCAVSKLTLGKSSTPTKHPPLSTDFTQQENPFTFQATPSETLGLSAAGADRVLSAVAQVQPDYLYADLYQLDEVKSRLDFDTAVTSHAHTALQNGRLDAAHLAALVRANNDAYLATKPFGCTDVDDAYILELCEFIVKIADLMAEKYPDLDWPRIYCNLGNLKIVYKNGMLNYAQVDDKIVLAISQNSTNILLVREGEDGFARVLTHEVMHILQLGCVCEPMSAAGRRAGIAMYWNDFTLNTTDWTWMVEGSAERQMCSLTGSVSVSYQYKMDYLCSMTMSVLLRESVEADTIETLCFRSDPELLFAAFGSQTQAQRDELLNLMITMQVLQMQPKAFHLAYADKYGVNLTEDEEALNQFHYSLKPAVAVTLAKEFYENLALFLRENDLPLNDIFFLINLFEGHLNQHLSYGSESKAQYNESFFQSYRILRSALFDALAAENPGLDLAALYENYEITSGENRLNADLSLLPAEKLAFLAERALWQQDLLALGVKVP